MNKPNFFIVGAAKCGTTALSVYLNDHASVYVSKPKEPHHFSSDLVTANKVKWTDDEYFDTCFSGVTSQHKAIGEASVFYLYSDVALKNIIKYNPDAKIIAMFRHPVEAAYSLHQQYYFSGWEDVSSFKDAWDLQGIRLRGEKIPKNFPVGDNFLQYKDIYKYGEQVERLLQHVPSDNFLPILFDDFKKDVSGTYKAVLDFIGVDYDGREIFEKINASKNITSPLLCNILKSKSIVATANTIKTTFGIKSFGVGRPQTPIDNKLKHLLTNEFSNDIEKLSRLINRDLSIWLD